MENRFIRRAPVLSSVLPVDFNHDGGVDYRIVATGTITFGFQIEGIGHNAVWSRPAGGLDQGSLIVPRSLGTEIESSLPNGDAWSLTETTPFGIAGPGFSSYSSAGVVGLFVDRTAFAGLQFSIGSGVYYGWMKVQEIPFPQGGGIVYEYAYDTRPNTPIVAVAVPEPTTVSLSILGMLFLFFRKRFREWNSCEYRLIRSD